MSTREKIVKAAASLFYKEGIRSVSVDAIADKAGITKRSLYYHFKSKDDLVEAYLAGRDQPNLDTFERWFGEAEGDAATKVRALFVNLAASARSPKWRGCGFLRTAAELVAMPGHPALKAANLHKTRFEEWLGRHLEPAGVTDADVLSRQIRLLLDGSFSVVLLNRDPSYMELAGHAAEALVRAELAARSPEAQADRAPA
ncbi:TetR/AcrR family transcriptional regulator [Enterovirga rhinocerotis]|uniref:TetR family transcriptional regulator n=1 Tax=Enterovirga rhinocerotis TaxID=1339210 RepID=A0A4R7C3R8_9HYPH|nr:TetR/AcrR family transcriptional regulator [Enterovirga rhinocerotis]TDR93094.1 TetR family transcriptional regulator [Enterovirga rhinocerotis]